MKSLEQDALKAQMVIAKSRESKKRGTLEQLAESPSPAPTPSPTPLEGASSLSLDIGTAGGGELSLKLLCPPLLQTVLPGLQFHQAGW